MVGGGEGKEPLPVTWEGSKVAIMSRYGGDDVTDPPPDRARESGPEGMEPDGVIEVRDWGDWERLGGVKIKLGGTGREPGPYWGDWDG